VLLYQEPCLASLALGGCGLDPGVAQQLVKNYPGAAELNPSPAYYDATVYSPLLHVVNGGPVSMSFSQAYQVVKNRLAQSPLNRNTALVDAATSWHNSVDNWAPLDPSVELVRMIGYDAGEPSSACSSAPCSESGAGSYSKGTGTISAIDVNTGDLYYDTGDGTVELNSANVYDPGTGLDYRNGAHDLYFCGISHQGLAQSTLVWEFAGPWLEGSFDYTHDDVKLGCPDTTDGTLQGVDLGNTASAAAARTAAATGPASPSLARGGLIEVKGGGFAPGSSVSPSLDSMPLGDGTIAANAQGGFSGTFGIPRGVALGSHTLAATGQDAQGAVHRLAHPVVVVALRPFGARSAISGSAFSRKTALPLAGICIRVYKLVRGPDRRGRLVLASRAITKHSGTYSITGLKPGTYKVEFTDCRRSRTYSTIWYPAATSSRKARVLRVVAGGERAMVNAAIPTVPTHHRRKRHR
jgi:hypothetical protein